MNETIRLELPEAVAQRAKEVALRSHRRFEDLLVEWIDRGANEAAIEHLPDDRLLALCDLQMDPAQQEQLSELLALNREGQLGAEAHGRLDELMRVYRRGMVRKAQAWHVAVQRGLRPPLN